MTLYAYVHYPPHPPKRKALPSIKFEHEEPTDIDEYQHNLESDEIFPSFFSFHFFSFHPATFILYFGATLKQICFFYSACIKTCNSDLK